MEYLKRINEMGLNLQKAQYLLLVLPLITFIFYKQNLWLITAYTLIFAIDSLYVYLLILFKKPVTKGIMIKSNNKLNDFWYIPYKRLFIMGMIVIIIAFIYSFYLSWDNLSLERSYSFILFLLHIFVATLDISVLLFLKKINKNIPEDIKKKLQKTDKNL